MTVTAPPRPPRPSDPVDRDELEALVEALIEEARQRARRRRRIYAASAALVALVVVAVSTVVDRTTQPDTASPALAKRSGGLAGAATPKIAFISEPPRGGYCGTVYVMNADGSAQRRLSNGGVPGCGQEGGPAWSPDGRRIAIVSNGTPSGTPCVVCDSQIYLINADGSEQRRLTLTDGFEHSPAWSPDGRRIAFVGPGDNNFTELYVVNADGSEQRRLTRTAGVERSLAWSPDGRRIAFAGSGDGNPEIYVVNADGSGQQRLTHNSGRDRNPVWSPDGRKIAFESNWQTWVMNADGSAQRRLTRNGVHNFAPAWSPDGRRIAFERGRKQRDPCSACPGSWGFDVYVMNADGSGQQRLTRGGSQPRWSLDGRKIAFVSKRDGNADIYVMNADGSGQRNLTRGAGRRESLPVWSPAQR